MSLIPGVRHASCRRAGYHEGDHEFRQRPSRAPSEHGWRQRHGSAKPELVRMVRPESPGEQVRLNEGQLLGSVGRSIPMQRRLLRVVRLGRRIRPGDSLIQAGTFHSDSRSDSPWSFYMWVRDGTTLGGQGNFYSQVGDIREGDRLHVYVHYEPTTGRAHFFMQNFSTGKEQGLSVHVGSAFYDGTSASVIDERPLVNGWLPQLTPFGTVSWHNAQVQNDNGAWRSLGAMTRTRSVMQDGDGTILSSPTNIDSSTKQNFQGKWKACGKRERPVI